MNHFEQTPDASPAEPGSGHDAVHAPQSTERPRRNGLKRLGRSLISTPNRGRTMHDHAAAATVAAPQQHHGHWHTHAAAPSHPTKRRGGSDLTRMVLLVVVILVALAGIGMASGVLQFGTPESVGVGAKGGSKTGSVTGDAWSYYHDRNYDTDKNGPKWSTDRTRSTDPDAAVLGDTTRWEYDGAYKYGPYGQDGMARRAAGRETADPLYSQPDPLPDVFEEYGESLDPAGDLAVGAPPSNYTNPYFDPYAGYSNPYANRLRLAYGEGYTAGYRSTP